MLNVRIAAVLAVVSLAGCATVDKVGSALSGATIDSSAVQVAVNAYDAAEVVAASYIGYCTAKPMPAGCSVSGVSSVHRAALAGRTARNSLEAFATGNTGVGNVATLYNALTAATSALTTIEAQYGATKS